MADRPVINSAQGDGVPMQTDSRGTRRLLLVNALAIIGVVIVAAAIYYFWAQNHYYYSTDDAIVTGPKASITASSAGQVTTIYHQLGDTIRAGQPIATLSAANNSQVNLNCPINGTIVSENLTANSIVPVGDPIATVIDTNNLSITTYVEENHITDIKPGQTVDITIDTVKDLTFEGTVQRILPVAASQLSLIPTSDNANGNFTKTTQRIPVQVSIVSDQGHTLFLGSSASVKIHIN